MRKVVLYIAMSLDGYIADKDGGVSWLSGDGSKTENASSYDSFVQTVDTVIIGYTTYHQITTELSPDIWPYDDKMSYVITHKKLENKENIVFSDNLPELITKLKNEDGKDIWICGGAGIVNQLIDLNLIDRFCITVIPTILGNGIKLFSKHNEETKLKFVSSYGYHGMIDLVYELHFPKNYE